MIEAKTIERLSWRIAELSQATGLSVPFLRKEARAGKLPTQKLGGTVIVLAEDAKAYLAGQSVTRDEETEAVA